MAGFQYTLPKDIRLNFDFEYKNYHYDHANIYFDVRRGDIYRNFTWDLSKDIGRNKNTTISLEYSRTINSSNIALYDYKKDLISAGVSWSGKERTKKMRRMIIFSLACLISFGIRLTYADSLSGYVKDVENMISKQKKFIRP